LGMVTYRAKQGQIEAARQLLSSVRARLPGGSEPCRAVQMGWAEANLQAAERRWPEAWASFDYVVEQVTRAGARWYRAQVLPTGPRLTSLAAKRATPSGRERCCAR